MDEETKMLARRAMACFADLRRWHGDRLVSATTDEAYRIGDEPAWCDGYVHTRSMPGDWSPAPKGLLIDLDDVGSRGCLLGLVREAHDAPDFFPSLTPAGYQIDGSGDFYPSEIAALVAAAEAANE